MAKKTAKKAARKPVKKQAARSRKPEPEPEFDNELRGALFKNKRKTKSAQPDYVGQATIDGIEYWVSSWARKSKNGQAYMSLAFTEKEEQGADEYEEDETDEDDFLF